MAPNIKAARAYKAMKALGYSSETIKAVLKNLLNLYDHNWELIEDEQYKVLLDAIIESEEHKGAKKKEQEFCLLDKPEEDEPNTKLARAYKTMKALGYSQQVVEPILKNLLDLYDQNWQLIEDEQYRVLLDAILENEECKGEKRKLQKSHISDEDIEDRKPGKRYGLRSRTLQTSPSCGLSSPIFNEAANKLLESCGKQKLTESGHRHRGDNKIEATVFSAPKNHQKAQRVNSQSYYSGLELTEKIQVFPDESEILLSDAAGSDGSIVPKMVINNEQGPSTVFWEEKNVKRKSNPSKQKNVPVKYPAGASSEKEQLPDDRSEFGVPLAVILPDSSGFLFDGISSKDYSPDPKEDFITSPEVIHLEAEDKHAQYLCGEDGASLELPRLEYNCLVSVEEKNYSSDSSQLDIASSSNGEAKISIAYKSSLGSNFCIPSLDAVLRRMEEDFLESHGIRQPGFCVMKFMKDFCECFLAAGTITADDKRLRATNVESDLGALKQDVLNGSINHEKSFRIAPNISLEALKVQNLIEVFPRITRLQGFNCPDFTCCKIDLPLNGAYGENCLNLKALTNLNPSTSSSMVIVQEQIFSHDMSSSTCHIEDITRGEEDLKVSLINEFNNEHQPNFKYIPRNISYQNAYVKFPLARISDDNCCSNCFGDCLSSEIPCACASETGGDFAYIPGGLVKQKFLEDCILINRSPQQKNLFYCEDCPLERSKNKRLSGKCKGHPFRKFIKECWYKCGCGMNCGNRVVQRGITVKLQVFMTPEGKGWGLRTLEDLPKGAFVCEYVGEVVTNMELFERNMRNAGEKHTYPVLLDADWGTEGVLKDEEALCLDATFYGNVARFINHRCDDANLVDIPVEVETPDHHYYHVAFFTTRKINALEELTWDYLIDFDDDTHPVKAFQCCCGSQYCRDIKPLKRRRTN